MKKWLGLLVVAIFGFCTINAFAADQEAVSASASESLPVLQGDAAQGPESAVDTSVATVKTPVNFGNFKSSTLVKKAWEALAQNDIESVLAYTNKCISLYAAPAAKMQAGLKDYPSGSNEEIFKYWALNDVATSYYIQGEAYRAANMKDESKEAYSKVANDFSFGQTWDVKGWFWKPGQAAKEKLDMMSSGSNWDFGDFTSSTLVQKAWAALAANDLKAVEAYVHKTVDLYGGKAKDMQASMKEYAWESKEKIMSNWALNDVGTSLFILGQAYQNAGQKEEAAKAYKRVVNEFFYAQCWDPNGWFWKPSEGAQQKLAELDNV